MMISRAAAVAAAATAADGSVASVQDTNMPTAASAAAGEQKPKRKPKLTLEQKRELTMSWFTSPQGDSVRIKDLPHGKAFVRRAARELKLVQLRKLRRSLSDEVQKAHVDGMARRRVLSYHPRQFAAQQEQKNISESQKTSTTSTSLDRNQIRSILLAFYGSTGRDAVPLGRHLRNCGVLAHKQDILTIVRSIGLRRMKRDGVSLEEATAKLDEVLATVSSADQKKADCAIVDCADHLDAMQIDTDDAAVPMVDTTKAKRQATRIAERRAQRKAQRQAVVEAKRAARILKKKQQQQQQQQQQNVRKAAQKQLPDKALAIIQSNSSLRKLVESEDAQTLLMEWYVDPSKPSIVDFLTSKDAMKGSDGDGDSSLLDTYKRPLRLLVKAGQLQRLRKAGAGRGKAVRAVEGVLARASATTPILQVSNGTVAKVSLKKNPNAAAALTSIKQDDLQKHLMQWFQDDSMPSVVDYLAAKDLPPSLRPAMAHMIKQLGLRQLRKDRRMASVQARRRINGALKGKGGKVGLQDKGKKDATDGDVPTTSSIPPSAPPAELLEEEDEYVSVGNDAIAAEDKAGLDLDFVVLH